jgi:hypothetical protein
MLGSRIGFRKLQTFIFNWLARSIRNSSDYICGSLQLATKMAVVFGWDGHLVLDAVFCWCMIYTMIRTNIFLSKPQKAALEKVARKKGISVAELVRRMVDKGLEKEKP